MTDQVINGVKMTTSVRKRIRQVPGKKVVAQAGGHLAKVDPRMPPFSKIIEREVIKMAKNGCHPEEVCVALELPMEALKMQYGRQFVKAVVLGNMEMAQTVRKMAKNGNILAAKFWLQARAGWRDKDKDEDNSRDPLEINIRIGG